MACATDFTLTYRPPRPHEPIPCSKSLTVFARLEAGLRKRLKKRLACDLPTRHTRPALNVRVIRDPVEEEKSRGAERGRRMQRPLGTTCPQRLISLSPAPEPSRAQVNSALVRRTAGSIQQRNHPAARFARAQCCMVIDTCLGGFALGHFGAPRGGSRPWPAGCLRSGDAVSVPCTVPLYASYPRRTKTMPTRHKSPGTESLTPRGALLSEEHIS